MGLECLWLHSLIHQIRELIKKQNTTLRNNTKFIEYVEKENLMIQVINSVKFRKLVLLFLFPLPS